MGYNDVTIKWAGERFIIAMVGAVNEGLTAASQVLARDIKETFARNVGGKPSAPFSPPASQSGELSKSWTALTAQGWQAAVVSNCKYARIHEFGGGIWPSNTKYLVIPVSIEAKRVMRNRTSARAVFEMLKNDKSRTKKMIRTKYGFVIVYARKIRGKTSKVKRNDDIVFSLRRSVALPARPYVKPTVTRAGPGMLKAFTYTTSRRLRAAGGVA